MRTTDRKLVLKIMLVGSVSLFMLLSSCRKQAARNETPAASPAGPEDPDLTVSASGYHGKHFTGRYTFHGFLDARWHHRV